MKPVIQSDDDRILRLLGVARTVVAARNASAATEPETFAEAAIQSIRAVRIRGVEARADNRLQMANVSFKRS